MSRVTRLQFLILVLLVSFSCSDNSDSTYDSFQNNHQSEISFIDIDLNKIEFTDVPSSYLGQAKIANDTLFFVDQKFNRVLLFDQDLTYLGWKLEKGNGPNEIPISEINGFEKLSSGNFMFLGSTTDWHIFTSQFQKINTYVMENTRKRSDLREISATNPVIYSFVYPKLIVRESKNRLFFNIMVQHPEFNFIDTHNEYFEQSRVLSEMDIATGKTINIFGRFSPFYQKNGFTLNHVSLLNFDVSKVTGNFYLNFEADPLIYQFDEDFKPIQSFGEIGKDMNPNYIKLETIEDFQRAIDHERLTEHYFTWLEYVEDGDWLFRSYSLGESDEDGLQIFKGSTLVGDVKVPKGFRVIRKLGDSFISHPITDEVNDKMIIYKFKLG